MSDILYWHTHVEGRAWRRASSRRVDACLPSVGEAYVQSACFRSDADFVCLFRSWLAEKIMARYSVAPLVAVGWEGFFGAFTIILLIPFLPLVRPTLPPAAQPFFDLKRGLDQMLNTPSVLWSGVAIAFSISLFNSADASETEISSWMTFQ